MKFITARLGLIAVAATLVFSASFPGSVQAASKPFGTCHESAYFTQPLARKYHFLELLSDGKGRVTLRDRQSMSGPLQEGKEPATAAARTEPSTDQTYRYNAAGSNWADDLPLPLAMSGRECSAQYASSNQDFFEITRLSQPRAGAVRMPGAPEDSRVDYALTTVQDHTHRRINFVCKVDAVNPLECKKVIPEQNLLRKQSQAEGKKLLESAPPPAGGGSDTGRNAEEAK